jgi:hypothetical protein
MQLAEQLLNGMDVEFEDEHYDPDYEPGSDLMWANISPRNVINRHHSRPGVLCAYSRRFLPLIPFTPDNVSTMCPYMDSSSFASTLVDGNKVRLLTYIRPLC